jgi:hypothetical protein
VEVAQGSAKRRIEPTNEIDEGGVHGVAEGSKLHDINAPFASLALADEGLRLAEALREIRLRQARLLSGPAELLQE